MPNNYRFYDIECLQNLFTNTIYDEKENKLYIYILFDQSDIPQEKQIIINNPDFLKKLSNQVNKVNPDFNGEKTLTWLDKHGYANMLEKLGGISNVNNIYTSPASKNDYKVFFENIKDFNIDIKSDIEFMKNEEDPLYIMGYNSSEYDLTILACIYDDIMKVTTYENEIKEKTKKLSFQEITPKLIRQYSNELFSSQFRGKGNKMSNFLQYPYQKYNYSDKDYSLNKNKIYKNWMQSGNHLDIMNMKPSANPIALKRLLGLLGRQIVEPNTTLRNDTKITTEDDLIDLICYNISDVINLPFVFQDKAYQSGFQTKTLMLKEYPELIFEKKQDSQEPDKEKVKYNRLKADDTSAKFSATSLFPYSKAEDIPCVSYMFPSPDKAKEFEIEPFDVLEFCDEKFKTWFPQPHLRKEWQRIYNFYDKLRGLNINFSENATFREVPNNKSKNLDEDQVREIVKNIKAQNTGLVYYDKDGNPTAGYALFKTGGIHGAEYDINAYNKDLELYQKQKQKLDKVIELYQTPEKLQSVIDEKNEIWKEQKNLAKKEKTKVPPEPEVFKLKTMFTRKGNKTTGYTYSWAEIKEPKLFNVTDAKGTELNKKYRYTSAHRCIHMDFESYYPFLLMLLSAFINKDSNSDRYSQNVKYKREYGEKKKKATTEEEKNRWSALREAVKLILNSASGYADAPFDNVIRMNNLTTSMRMIGQLLTWFIGQSQTILGGLVISTNTDGLYVVNPNYDIAVKQLEKDAKNIHINIEPEDMFLVSKDTNNRIEFNSSLTKIDKTNGGSVSAYKGPNVANALDHPALYDYIIVKYIAKIKDYPNLINKPMNLSLAQEIISELRTTETPIKQLLYLQNILASSSTTLTFNISTDFKTKERKTLQKVNRVFIMKPNTPNTVNLESVTFKKLTPATIKRRTKNKECLIQSDMYATRMLKNAGVTTDEFNEMESENKEAVFKKIKGIDQSWNMYIQNKSLYHLSEEEQNFILDNADWDRYILEASDTFNKDWSNCDHTKIKIEEAQD